jgi:steroid delta-isomerase-like uncharacterized protein
MTSFRRAQQHDVATLTELAQAAYALYTSRMDRVPAPMTVDYAELVHSAAVWVAEQDARVVGMVTLVPDHDVLLLDNLAVWPDMQGGGIGTRLLELAERVANQHGAREIRLYTNEAMTENLQYYPRHGYAETHRAGQDGYRRVFFSKRLSLRIEHLVRRFYAELWNRWNDELVEDLLADDFEFRGSLGTTTRGRDGWRRYRDGVRAAAPDFHNELVELIADGERAAARLSYTGTHSGPLAGIPPTGRRFEYSGAAFFASAQGKLTSAWVLGDLVGLRGQLLPAQAPD